MAGTMLHVMASRDGVLLTDPLRSSVSLSGSALDGWPQPDAASASCGPGRAVVIIVHARSSEGHLVDVGGDVILVDVAGTALRTSVCLRDHGNGTYSGHLFCSALREERHISISVRLVLQLRRPQLPRQLWGRNGWDELPLFATTGGFQYRTYTVGRNGSSSLSLRNLHQCASEQLVGGTPLKLRIAHAANLHEPLSSCSLGAIRAPYFARCPPTLPRSVRLAMNLGAGRSGSRQTTPTFDHCVYSAMADRTPDGSGASCIYSYLAPSDVLQCLQGKRILFLGDSVTSAMFRDLVSMFGAGAPSNRREWHAKYPGGCPDNRTEAQLNAAFARSPHTSAKQNRKPVIASLYGGLVNLSSLSINEARNGLPFALSRWWESGGAAELIQSHDIVLVESSRCVHHAPVGNPSVSTHEGLLP